MKKSKKDPEDVPIRQIIPGQLAKSELKQVPIATLIPYEKNPRKNADAVDKVAASLKEFGLVKNSVLCDENMVLITGHTTIKAMQKLGWDKVPEVTQVSGLTENQKKAYRIADNKLGEIAEWDLGLLTEQLNELKIDGMDISITGFDEKEFSKMLKSLDTTEVKQDDFINPPKIKTKIKPGDILSLGIHRLMCGSSMDKKQVSSLLNGELADLLYYDPPYENPELWNCAIPARITISFTDSKHVKEALSVVNNYKFIYEFVWDTVISWYLDNRPLCRHRSAFIGQDNPGYDSEAAVINDGKHRKELDRKSNLGEYTYKPLPEGQVRLTTIFQKSKADLPAEHGKPIEWIAPIIAGCHPKNVVDLFGGAGSTLIACEQIGVPCLVMEIDPVKCQLIVNRFEKYQKGKV